MPAAEVHELSRKGQFGLPLSVPMLTEFLGVNFTDRRDIIHMESLHGPSTGCRHVEEANQACLRLRFAQNVRYETPLDNIQRGGDVAL